MSKKIDDTRLIQLNSIGLSLSTIAETFNCHPTSVSNRLADLGIEPADTRRAFMEDVYAKLTPTQQQWLVGQLGPHISIKDFILNLLVERFIQDQQKAAA